MKFEPVQRRTISLEVREQLAASIEDGLILPGSQLPSERALCEQFGVARTSVREAIQGLVSLGVLERRGNRTVVAESMPDVQFTLDGVERRAQRVRELFEVRELIEVPLARMAATRAGEADRVRIAGIAKKFNADLNLAEYRQLDHAFHWAVAKAAGNETLLELYGKVLESLLVPAAYTQVPSGAGRSQAVHELLRTATTTHRLIAKAIAAGDGPEAAAAADNHLRHIESLIG